METSRATLSWWFLIHHKKWMNPSVFAVLRGSFIFVLWIWYFLCLTALYHMCFLFAISQHTFKAVFLYAVLLYTHACTVTWFCRCFAFQIGKICYQKCIVRNFQFRKFLPVYSNVIALKTRRENLQIRFSTFLFNFQIIFSNFSVLIPVSEFFSFYRCSSSSLFLCTPVIAYSAHSAIFVAWSPMRS